jgi:hypothetical protein
MDVFVVWPAAARHATAAAPAPAAVTAASVTTTASAAGSSPVLLPFALPGRFRHRSTELGLQLPRPDDAALLSVKGDGKEQPPEYEKTSHILTIPLWRRRVFVKHW